MTETLWWHREQERLVDDIAIALTRFASRLQRPGQKVIVYQNEYNGEEVAGLVLETTAQRANRKHVVVL